jgi:hypothetical protein
VQHVLANAVQWAAPRVRIADRCPESAPLETLRPRTGQFAHVGIQQNQQDIE